MYDPNIWRLAFVDDDDDPIPDPYRAAVHGDVTRASTHCRIACGLVQACSSRRIRPARTVPHSMTFYPGRGGARTSRLHSAPLLRPLPGRPGLPRAALLWQWPV